MTLTFLLILLLFQTFLCTFLLILQILQLFQTFLILFQTFPILFQTFPILFKTFLIDFSDTFSDFSSTDSSTFPLFWLFKYILKLFQYLMDFNYTFSDFSLYFLRNPTLLLPFLLLLIHSTHKLHPTSCFTHWTVCQCMLLHKITIH